MTRTALFFQPQVRGSYQDSGSTPLTYFIKNRQKVLSEWLIVFGLTEATSIFTWVRELTRRGDRRKTGTCTPSQFR